MIIVGLVREIFGSLPHVPCRGAYGQARPPDHSSLITFGLIFVLMRAFANGGSSLTGIEAVSNAVSAFKPPEGVNARRVLVIEGTILGTLVAGISWLAHVTHATPYKIGVPTVMSQEAKLVFGSSAGIGHVGASGPGRHRADPLHRRNTSFNGFPFLANFVAEDAFLPRWLTKRGHRLVFSNGIIVLAIVSSRCWPSSGRTSTTWCRSMRSACSPRSPWPDSAWPCTTTGPGTGLAPQAGHQLRGRA